MKAPKPSGFRAFCLVPPARPERATLGFGDSWEHRGGSGTGGLMTEPEKFLTLAQLREALGAVNA